MATGYSKEKSVEFPGSEHMISYGEMSIDPADFEGQNVLILGMHSYSLILCLIRHKMYMMVLGGQLLPNALLYKFVNFGTRVANFQTLV